MIIGLLRAKGLDSLGSQRKVHFYHRGTMAQRIVNRHSDKQTDSLSYIHIISCQFLKGQTNLDIFWGGKLFIWQWILSLCTSSSSGGRQETGDGREVGGRGGGGGGCVEKGGGCGLGEGGRGGGGEEGSEDV